MIHLAPPLLAKLTPVGGVPSLVHSELRLPCGILWDALRTPHDLGLPVLLQLLEHDEDMAALGPVLSDGHAEVVYWLVSPGHSADGWPEGCDLLTAGDWLAVPDTGEPHRLVWLHMPARPIVTAPPWLAIVLGERAAELSLGGS